MTDTPAPRPWRRRPPSARRGKPAGTKTVGGPLGRFAASVPNARLQASKGLKTLKTARAGYWLKLACTWDRRHVRQGPALFCESLGMRQIRRVQATRLSPDRCLQAGAIDPR
jgi:hypothetical protein